MSAPLSIEVLDIPQVAACTSCGCGSTWSSREITEIVREEMARRFGDKVTIAYLDVKDREVSLSRASIIERIEERSLLYPVTVVDGEVIYDGAVSYPMIMRAVTRIIGETEA